MNICKVCNKRPRNFQNKLCDVCVKGDRAYIHPTDVFPCPQYTPNLFLSPPSPQYEYDPPPKRARTIGTNIEPIDVEKTAEAEEIV